MSTSPLPSPGGPVGKCVVFGCTQIGQPKFCAQHSTALRRPSINVQTGFNRATSGIFNLSPSLPPDASPAPMLVRRSTTTLLVPGGKLPTDYWNRSPQRSPQRSPTRSLPREIDESAEYQLPPSPDFSPLPRQASSTSLCVVSGCGNDVSMIGYCIDHLQSFTGLTPSQVKGALKRASEPIPAARTSFSLMPSSALTESLSKPPTTGAIETAIDEAALDRIFNDVMQLTDETEAQRWLSTIDQPSISLLARNLLSSSFRFRNMLNLAREISAPSLDPADILPHILDACSQILTAECWCLCLADPVSLAWLPVMEKTFPRPTNNAFAAMAAAITTYNMDDAWVQTVLQRTAQSARVFSWSRSTSAFDPTLFELNDEIPNQIRSVLCVPLMDADKVVVTLLLAVNKFHRNDAAWNEDKFYRGELATAEILALLSSNTLQHATMYENALISRRQAEVMLYLQRELNSESGTERVIQKIFESTVTLVNAQHVTLFLLDKKRDEFIARFFVALDNFSLQNDDQSNSRRISMSAAGMAGHILNSGRSVRVDCIGNDPRFNDTEHFVIDRPGISSKGLALIATPVLDQDGCCIAVIQATKSLDEGFGFSEDDESLLGSLSSAAGLALRKAQMYDSSLQAQRQTQALLRLVKAGSSWHNVTVDTLLERVTGIAYDLLDADRVLLYFVDHTHGEMWCLLNKYNYSASAAQDLKVDDEPQPSPAVARRPSMLNRSRSLITPADAQASLIYPTPFTSPMGDFSNRNPFSPSLHNKSLSTDTLIRPPATTEHSNLCWTVPTESGLAGLTARTCTFQSVSDASSDARNDPAYDRQFNYQTRALLCAPILDADGQTMAVLEARNRKSVRATFDETDMDLLRAFCSEVSTILRKHVTDTLLERLAVSSIRRRTSSSTSSNLVRLRLPGALQTEPESPIGSEISHDDRESDVTSMLAAYMHTPSTPWASTPLSTQSRTLQVSTAFVSPPLTTGLNRSSFLTKAGRATLTPSSTPMAGDSPASAANSAAAALTRSLQRSAGRRHIPLSPANAKTPSNGTSATNLISPSFQRPQTIMENSPTLSAVPNPPCMTQIEVATSEKPTEEITPCSPVECATEPAVALPDCASPELSKSTSVSKSSSPYNNGRSLILPTSNSEESAIQPWLFELRALVLSGDITISESVTWSLHSPLLTNGFAALRTLDFCVFDYTVDELMPAVLLMFEDLGLLSDCGTPRLIAEQFVSAIKSRYRIENPFHNFHHAVAVLHFMYYSLLRSGAMVYLNKLDIIGLLVASLCHDVAHPGHTNAFEMNSHSALAMRYNDRSLLENYHAFVTFQVLRDQRCDIFANVPAEDLRTLRKVIIDAILATDMAEHFTLCKKLDLVLASSELTPTFSEPSIAELPACNPAAQTQLRWSETSLAAMSAQVTDNALFDVNKPDDRQLLCATLIHAADLSGQVYSSSELAQQWELRISLEFQAQALKEASLNMPVAPFMTNLDDIVHRARMQISFIDFVLSPLWKAVARTFPLLRPCLDNMYRNRQQYEILIARVELQRSEGCPEVVPSLMLPKSRQPNSTSTNTLGGRHGFNGGDSDSELDK